MSFLRNITLSGTFTNRCSVTCYYYYLHLLAIDMNVVRQLLAQVASGPFVENVWGPNHSLKKKKSNDYAPYNFHAFDRKFVDPLIFMLLIGSLSSS